MLYKILYFARNRIYVSFVTDNQLIMLRRKRKFFLKWGRIKLSLSNQLQLFEFLSLYYSDGDNLYTILLKYQQFADKNIKRVIKLILMKIRRGEDVSRIFQQSGLFEPEINPFLLISSLLGMNKNILEKMASFLRAKNKNQKELKKKMAYPLTLLFMGFIIMIFVSYSIIPSFISFFQDSSTEIPFMLKLLSKQHLWKVGLFGFFLAVLFYLLWISIPVKKKVAIPILNNSYKAKFQEKFWQICLLSIETGISLEQILSDYINREEEKILKYYFSTILSKLQQGIPFDKAIDITLIDKKLKILTSLATDNDRKKQLYENFIKESEEKSKNAQELVANIISSLALLLIAGIIVLLGYVMLTPLRQISEII